MNDVPDHIRAMQAPAFYPHPVREVSLRETHISWVFLTGSRVYKVKKPVDPGFLDFTTLERREHFCRAGSRAQPAPGPGRLPRSGADHP